jgi:formylglycine-generating enzyme required for sulfatase activity
MESRMMETRLLGDYTVIKQIGQGSLGSVYLAEHRFMKTQYVLKVLPDELSSDRAFVQRFEEDVGLLTALDHANIVKIHNISFAQGHYFLVTDCVVDEVGETTNLAQYMLARGKLFEEETLFRLLKQIADALDYAHSKKGGGKGIIHRNLKLNNILVAKGKGGIELAISDFGLSRIIGSGAVLSRTYKMVAEALGSGVAFPVSKGQDRYPNPPPENQKLIPLHASFLQNYAFLAPEQRRLDHPYPVDVKADVYAFGVLAYYLLMGEFPEGYFEMPSHVTDYAWNWDSLIQSCLQAKPSLRPELLVPALEAIRHTENICSLPLPQRESHDAKETTPEFSSGNTSSSFAKREGQKPFGALPETSTSPSESKKSAIAEQPSSLTLQPIIRMAQIERPQADLDPAASLQVDTAVKNYTPERKEVKNIQPLLTDMVVISGGTFFRGSKDGNRDEMPRHQVTLHSFAIDIHPVTNEQFVRFLEVMGGEKDSNHQDIIRMRDSRIKRSGGKLSIESGYAKHPVVGVTWYGALAYAKWVGKRLPTEAEWEIAARGGLENVFYPTGDDIEKTQANFFSSDTIAVMSYAPNGYGLYDMGGNVYEWCYDWYGYNYYEISVQEPENPKGPLQGVYRVLRGGCWKSLKEDLRCSRRHRNNPGTVNGTYGFRCAADVQPIAS